jgi:hypothetical protein
VDETIECADELSLRALLDDVARHGGRVVAVIKEKNRDGDQNTGGYSVKVEYGTH